MHYTSHYVIRWDCVQTLEDVKRILRVLDPRFDPDFSGVETIMDLCELQPKGKPIAVMD